MIMGEIPVTYEEAAAYLKEHGSVRRPLSFYNTKQ
jgi:N-acetylmuramic acid 6-phosphate etherase